MFDVLQQIRDALAHLFLRCWKFPLGNLHLRMHPYFSIFFFAIAKEDHAWLDQKASVMFPEVIRSTDDVHALAWGMVHPFSLLLDHILQGISSILSVDEQLMWVELRADATLLPILEVYNFSDAHMMQCDSLLERCDERQQLVMGRCCNGMFFDYFLRVAMPEEGRADPLPDLWEWMWGGWCVAHSPQYNDWTITITFIHGCSNCKALGYHIISSTSFGN